MSDHLSDAGKKVAAVLAGESNGCIINGDCLERLREIPDGSVQCCVTSPPYWGLRSYGVPPTAWPPPDNEALARLYAPGEACEGHVWGDAMPRPGTESRNGEGGGSCFEGREDKAAINAAMTRAPRKRSPSDIKDPNSKQATSRASAWDSDASGGQYCQRCGAWLGCYGLEPTPELYVWHTVLIFREVRRVLREDGTLWLNLGDSYVGGKGQSGSKGAEHQAKRNESGESLNKAHQTLGGPKDTKPTDSRAMMRQSGLKPKDLVGVPWRVAFALQADGWWLRQDIIWAKPNPMPESVTDRCTKAHEYIFLMSKAASYYYDHEAVREPVAEVSIARSKYGWNCDRPSTKNASMGGGGIHTEKMGTRFVNPAGRNKRSVWTVATQPYRGAHYAVFPPKLITPCILAGCPAGGVALDPFIGSGTTGMVCVQHGRRYLGIELKPDHVEQAYGRISGAQPPLFSFR
jgi:DNA modification methylase